jgi:hypothetical protein
MTNFSTYGAHFVIYIFWVYVSMFNIYERSSKPQWSYDFSLFGSDFLICLIQRGLIWKEKLAELINLECHYDNENKKLYSYQLGFRQAQVKFAHFKARILRS